MVKADYVNVRIISWPRVSPKHRKVITVARLPSLPFFPFRREGSKMGEVLKTYGRSQLRFRIQPALPGLATSQEVLNHVLSFQIVFWRTISLTHILTRPISYIRTFTRDFSEPSMRLCGHNPLLDIIHVCHGSVYSTWSSSMGVNTAI